MHSHSRRILTQNNASFNLQKFVYAIQSFIIRMFSATQISLPCLCISGSTSTHTCVHANNFSYEDHEIYCAHLIDEFTVDVMGKDTKLPLHSLKVA